MPPAHRTDPHAVTALVEAITGTTEDGRWIDCATGKPGVGSDGPDFEQGRAVGRQRYARAKTAVEGFAAAMWTGAPIRKPRPTIAELEAILAQGGSVRARVTTALDAPIDYVSMTVEPDQAPAKPRPSLADHRASMGAGPRVGERLPPVIAVDDSRRTRAFARYLNGLLSFADVTSAVSLLALGDRDKTTPGERSQLASAIIDMLSAIAVAVGADTEQPLAPMVQRVMGERRAGTAATTADEPMVAAGDVVLARGLVAQADTIRRRAEAMAESLRGMAGAAEHYKRAVETEKHPPREGFVAGSDGQAEDLRAATEDTLHALGRAAVEFKLPPGWVFDRAHGDVVMDLASDAAAEAPTPVRVGQVRVSLLGSRWKVVAHYKGDARPWELVEQSDHRTSFVSTEEGVHEGWPTVVEEPTAPARAWDAATARRIAAEEVRGGTTGFKLRDGLLAIIDRGGADTEDGFRKILGGAYGLGWSEERVVLVLERVWEASADASSEPSAA